MYSALTELLCGIFLAVFLLSAWNWWSRRRYRELLNKIPGPRGLPFIGNALLLAENELRYFQVVQKCIKQFGNVFKLTVGNAVGIGISDPKDAEIILKDRNLVDHSKIMTSALKSILGNGLVSSGGNTWRHHRKILSPLFNTLNVRHHADVFIEKAELLSEKFKLIANGKPRNIFNIVAETALEATVITIMGIREKSMEDIVKTLLYGFQKSLEVIQQQIVRPWLHFETLLNRSQTGKEARKLRANLIDFCTKNLNKRYSKNMLEIFTKDTSNGSVNTNNSDGYSLLDHLVEHLKKSDNGLSESDVIDEIVTFVFASHDTTATALCSALTYLGLYPEHQDNIYRELQTVLGDVNRSITFDDVARMEYLERFIKETLRLSPPVFLIPREIHKDVELTTCTLPAGTIACLLVISIHRNPDYYPEPDKFDPARFLPEMIEGRHPLSFMPFGAGHRNCVGIKYAMLQMKIFLAHIVRNTRILPGTTREDLEELRVSAISRPASGFHVGILPR